MNFFKCLLELDKNYLSYEGLHFVNLAQYFHTVVFFNKLQFPNPQRWFLYPPEKTPDFHPNVTTLQWLHEKYPDLSPADMPLECTINKGEVRIFAQYCEVIVDLLQRTGFSYGSNTSLSRLGISLWWKKSFPNQVFHLAVKKAKKKDSYFYQCG